MKKSRTIVPAASGLAVLLATVLMASPVQAQRGGDRHDSRSSSHSRTTSTRSHASHQTSQHRYHGQSRYSSHRPFINVDFGNRCVPHTVSKRVYVPGHYHSTTQRVLASAGHYDRVVVPARYEMRYHNGHYDRVCVEPERVQQVWHPAEYDNRVVKTWVPGYYKNVQSTHYHKSKPSITLGGILRF